MTTRHRFGVVVALMLPIAFVACLGQKSVENPLVRGMENPTETIREGCNIAREKCTRCHTMDQLLATNVASPQSWRHYVRRMCAMPGAGIYRHEEPKIVECLVYRSFGDEGLARLEEPKP